MKDITTLERAFQLANSGACASVDEIRKRLKQEGFSVAQFTGRALLKQLRELIGKARQAHGNAAGPTSSQRDA